MGIRSNPLKRLLELGQAPWLDDLSRELVSSGDLRRLVDRDGLAGVTSNPQIFDRAIAEAGGAYEDDIGRGAAQGHSAAEILDGLTIADVQVAADVFADRHRETKGEHGWVSLEVDPNLARDTEGTVMEARRLHAAVDRPNVYIKVPATDEGVPAIRQLLVEGIHVNVTLLFGLRRYHEVLMACLEGVADRLDQRQPVAGLRAVHSFFLSRIDAYVDPLLDRFAEGGGEEAKLARSLRGKAAIASAKLAYQMCAEVQGTAVYQRLFEAEARPCRLLWASTGTKDPAYDETLYVDALIGPETICTMPRKTLDAYRQHGDPFLRIDTGLDEAHRVVQGLRALHIDLDEVAQQLEKEGIDKFVQPWGHLLSSIRQRMDAAPRRRSPSRSSGANSEARIK